MRENGISLITKERRRQIEIEGWSAEHDAKHVAGSLSMAAACYAADRPIFIQRATCCEGRTDMLGFSFENPWPFGARWYKPGDRLWNLIKAGALIAAEIDKLLAEGEAREAAEKARKG